MNLPAPACLWDFTAAPLAPFAPLAGEVTARVAVVGAGYTGLSAALHMAEAGQDVVVLDAQQPGWGASGRNGGQVIAGVKHDPAALLALFGEDVGQRLVACVGAAPDMVFELIGRLGIGCEAVRTGWLQLAVSEANMGVLRARAGQWRAQGAECAVLDADAVAAMTGSGAYVGGMLDARGGTVQPLAYARGLAASVVRAGGQVFGGSAVTGLRGGAGGWELHTAGGVVRAERVILATNAYADRLQHGLRRSVVAVPSWQVATEVLPPDLSAGILPGLQAGSDMRRLLCYFRRDAAGRFVLGSRGAFADPQPASSVRRLCDAAVRIFPQLRGVAFTRHWGGMVAVTPDHLPHLHMLAPGLFAGLGYNGRGVALATAMGAELAKLAAGAPAESLGIPVTALRPLRLHAASRLGVRAAIAWYRLLDRVA